MKLNYWRTICVGFAFFLICAFWQAYDSIIPKILTDKFGMAQGWFEIIDIPCNQFAGQTPGTDDEIHQFCTLKYNTKFPQMKKSDVNGENALALYGYLKSQQGFEGFGKGAKALAMSALLKKIDKDYKNNPEIKWNFTKFIVDRNGNVVKRFEPTVKMDKVEEYIKTLL